MEKALTIIREKQVPVSNLDALLPSQVVERLREPLGHFTQSDHTRCWQHYEVRPAGDSDHPERTKPLYEDGGRGQEDESAFSWASVRRRAVRCR